MMDAAGREIRWAPRVPRGLIRRLYEREAAGSGDVNLIEGNETSVMAFLDELFVGLGSPPEAVAEYTTWRDRLFLNSERRRI